MDFWDNLSLHKNKIVVILVVLAAFYWVTIPEDEGDDPYIIYIEYDCRSVIRNPDNHPESVIVQCREIIEEQNAPKASKRITRT